MNNKLERTLKEAPFEVLSLDEIKKTSKTSVTITDLQPRCEPVTSGIRSSSANHSTITFGKLSIAVTDFTSEIRIPDSPNAVSEI